MNTSVFLLGALLGGSVTGLFFWLRWRTWQHASSELASRVCVAVENVPGKPKTAQSIEESLRVVSMGLTSLQAAEQRIRQENALLFECLERLPVGVVLLDQEWKMHYCNPSAAGTLGITPNADSGPWELLRQPEVRQAFAHLDHSSSCELEMRTKAFAAGPIRVHGWKLSQDPYRVLVVLEDVSRLRQLESMRQDFVANVSHELKTPLTAIRAAAETLLEMPAGEQDAKQQFLQLILSHTQRLENLVRDLLTLGRIEAGRHLVRRVPLLLQDAARNALQRHDLRARDLSLTLIADLPEQPITVLADEEAVAQILDNLVDNALKYTPPGGTVWVRCRADDLWGILEVADTGIGIAQKDLPRIFERFYRVDKARSRELGGTGLGLAIVKHWVQTLEGNISVRSEVNRGSTFTVRLPLYKDTTEDRAARAGEAPSS